MKYSLLVVTDHTNHVSSNSMYELSTALLRDSRCREIWVCSRGAPSNHDFFSGMADAPINAIRVTPNFAYEVKGISLTQELESIDPARIDAILIRMPQPLNKAFLLSLQQLLPIKVIINDPAGTIETSSKAFLLNFPHLCPPVKLCHDLDEIIALSREMEIVLKPLYSYGGKDIARLSRDHFWLGMDQYPAEEIYNRLPVNFLPMLAMKFLRNVKHGDKRTIVVNRKIIGSALRMPPQGSWICNVAQGGYATMSEADDHELLIEEELTPLLYEKGIIMYGFDTLMEDDGTRVLSEINTLSIGGLGPMEEMSGLPVVQMAASQLWDYIEKSG
jgi:glutathione synthase